MAALLGRATDAHGATGRTLEYALAASIVLHAALLLGLRELRLMPPPEAPTLAPLVARLAETKAEPKLPPSTPAPAPVARPEPKPAPRTTPKPRPKAVPKPIARPQASPDQVTTVPPAAPAASPLPEPAAPVEAAPATAAPPASVAPQRAASEPAAGPTTDAMLAQYRLAIIEAARRYKRYPRVALDNNWQGKAQVQMAIGANGTIASMTIKTSSGHDILDRQALEMIRNAKPLTAIPAGLLGKPFAIEIPVVFSLEDPDS